MMNYKIYKGPIQKEDKMNDAARQSFLDGYLTVELPKGFVLWRFLSKRVDKYYGAFWIDGPTMDSIMRSLHTTGNFSEFYKKENVRNSLAILDEWSNLSWRMKVTLTRDVIAYVGKTGSQKQFVELNNTTVFGGSSKMEKTVELRIGGFEQFVIPRFRGLENENNWARMDHFAHI